MLSPQEKKARLLEFLEKQRRLDAAQESDDSFNHKNSGTNTALGSAMIDHRSSQGNLPHALGAVQTQKRYQAGGVNFPPYGLHPSNSLANQKQYQNNATS